MRDEVAPAFHAPYPSVTNKHAFPLHVGPSVDTVACLVLCIREFWCGPAVLDWWQTWQQADEVR